MWIVPPRAATPLEWTPPGEYGASLRFYDARIDAWRSTWHGPVHGIVWPFIARQEGDEMARARTDDDSSQMRWIFSRIEARTFHWRALRSTDDGATWRLEQEMFATRSDDH